MIYIGTHFMDVSITLVFFILHSCDVAKKLLTSQNCYEVIFKTLIM